MRKLSEQEQCLIKFKRIEAGLTVDALAKELLMSKSNLSRIENGKIAVSEDNLRLIENFFSINFSLDEMICKRLRKELHKIIKDMIFFKLVGKNLKLLMMDPSEEMMSSVVYPLFMLTRIAVYAARNLDNYFVRKYLEIFEKMKISLDDDEIHLLGMTKFQMLYHDKKYEQAIEFYNTEYVHYKRIPLYDSYLLHLRAFSYYYINDEIGSIKTIEDGIKVCNQIGNLSRLLSFYTLKNSNVRRMNKSVEALKDDLKTLKIATENNIHHLDFALHNNIGWSYFMLNNYELAIKYYTKAETYDINNDICFSMAASYFELGNREKCKEYIAKGRVVRSSGIAFPYLLDWLELSLNKKYSYKAEQRLLICLKKCESEIGFESRNTIYKLLIEHYKYHKNEERLSYYQNKYYEENELRIQSLKNNYRNY